jgi:hypothetical protein
MNNQIECSPTKDNQYKTHFTPIHDGEYIHDILKVSEGIRTKIDTVIIFKEQNPSRGPLFMNKYV